MKFIEMDSLMPINNFYIRLATADDVPSILAFIKGLAEFEYLSDEVTVTEEDLRKSLFGPNPSAEVVIGFSGGEPAGFAVFFHNYSTFLGRHGMYLEDIFVNPEFRRKGLGKMLLVYVADIAVERECGRFEWSVLDWNEDAARFYKELGAEVMSDWRTFRMQGVALRRLAKSIQS